MRIIATLFSLIIQPVFLHKAEAALAMSSSGNGSLSGNSDTIEYFSDPEINYFGAPASGTVDGGPSIVESKGPEKELQSGVKSAFNWNKYLNPKNDEFFKEGDYTPPAPFMEIARDPSDQNIKNWFQYLELKNTLHKRLQTRLTEYQQNSRPTTLVSAHGFNPMPELPPVIPSSQSVRIRMYFDSHCPHCKRMMGELKRLANQGFYIELKQVDQDQTIRRELEFPASDASKSELSQYKIESVPTLLVANIKAGKFIKLQGYQTAEDIVSAIQNQIKP